MFIAVSVMVAERLMVAYVLEGGVGGVKGGFLFCIFLDHHEHHMDGPNPVHLQPICS
jgi:hypothetical protein